MRISDWISDVFSSDLCPLRRLRQKGPVPPHAPECVGTAPEAAASRPEACAVRHNEHRPEDFSPASWGPIPGSVGTGRPCYAKMHETPARVLVLPNHQHTDRKTAVYGNSVSVRVR